MPLWYFDVFGDWSLRFKYFRKFPNCLEKKKHHVFKDFNNGQLDQLFIETILSKFIKRNTWILFLFFQKKKTWLSCQPCSKAPHDSVLWMAALVFGPTSTCAFKSGIYLIIASFELTLKHLDTIHQILKNYACKPLG